MQARSTLLLLLVVGWALPVRYSHADEPASPPPIAHASNHIGCDLYRVVAAESSANLAVSPTSVTTVLGMLRLGARGDSARRLDETLTPAGEGGEFHPALGGLLDHLAHGDDGIQWHCANRMWLDEQFTVRPEFRQALSEHYGADLVSARFGRPGAVRNAANEWVRRATQGAIDEIVPAGWLVPETRFVLASAMRLSAPWQYPFDPRQTRTAPFHTSSGRERAVPMMTITQTLRYAHPDGVQLVELPYRGKNLALVLAVPDERDGLPQIERRLTVELLQQWTAALHEPAEGEPAAGFGPGRGNWAQVTLSLPRFKVAADLDLTEALTGMGLGALFRSEADFSGIVIDGSGLIVQGVRQAVRLEVDEHGTKLAAATAAKGAFGGAPRNVTVRADRPFLYWIRDARTGVVLVLGRMGE
jgi:serpin B